MDNRKLPEIDIVHFDGHGVFDGDSETGYLLCEDEDRKLQKVSAEFSYPIPGEIDRAGDPN